MNESLWTLIAACVGSALTYLLTKQNTTKTRNNEKKLAVRNFTEILQNTVFDSTIKNKVDIDKVSRKIADNNGSLIKYPRFHYPHNYLPIKNMFSDGVLKESLYELKVDFIDINNFLLYISLTKDDSLSQIIKRYNILLSKAIKYHNSIYHKIHLVEQDEEKRKIELVQNTMSLDRMILDLNAETLEALTESKKNIEKLELYAKKMIEKLSEKEKLDK